LQPEWPADKVERRAVAALIPYARNARTHSPEQVDQIAASIREWGWTGPVLVDDEGGIIAGHGHVLAAHKLAIAEVPVMVAAGWSEAQKRAYVIADNKLALNAGWDDDLLKIELGDLQAFDFDLGLIGFSADEIAGLTFDRSGLTDPDEAPDAPAIPVSELGDVWLLGKHRPVCGDCTDPLVVDKALNGVKPHLMVTDPPYGVEYDAAWRGLRTTRDGKRTSLGVHAKGKVENDDRADWRGAWTLFPGDVAYVWCASLHTICLVCFSSYRRVDRFP
jgi:ParB-like nuclease domain